MTGLHVPVVNGFGGSFFSYFYVLSLCFCICLFFFLKREGSEVRVSSNQMAVSSEKSLIEQSVVCSPVLGERFGWWEPRHRDGSGTARWGVRLQYRGEWTAGIP